MKRCLLILLTCAATLAAAQQLFTYRDKNGDLSIKATSGLVQQGSSQKIHLELRGSPVVLTSKSDALQITASSLKCDATVKSTTKVDRAIATGGVKTIKTTPSGATQITASSGVYSAGAQGGTIRVSGAVTIRSAAGSRVTLATGTGGTAEIAVGNKATGSGLRRATLLGPVRVEARQENGSTVVATGSRLDLDNISKTITISGRVNVSGRGTGAFGELSGADRAILVLNSRGEVSSVRVTQGASQ